jgi:hypothetical protein
MAQRTQSGGEPKDKGKRGRKRGAKRNSDDAIVDIDFLDEAGSSLRGTGRAFRSFSDSRMNVPRHRGAAPDALRRAGAALQDQNERYQKPRRSKALRSDHQALSAKEHLFDVVRDPSDG